MPLSACPISRTVFIPEEITVTPLIDFPRKYAPLQVYK
jgi:hypothetical protein